MEKIILSEELLMGILKNSYNDATIEHYLNATGIVRRIDDLGRVVIPKEIRRTM